MLFAINCASSVSPVAPDCAPGFEQQQRLAEMSDDVGLEARRPPRSALLTPPPPSSGRPPNPLALAVAHSACSMHQWQSMCGVRVTPLWCCSCLWSLLCLSPYLTHSLGRCSHSLAYQCIRRLSPALRGGEGSRPPLQNLPAAPRFSPSSPLQLARPFAATLRQICCGSSFWPCRSRGRLSPRQSLCRKSALPSVGSQVSRSSLHPTITATTRSL